MGRLTCSREADVLDGGGRMIPVHVRLAELNFRKGVHAGVRRLYPLSSSFTQLLDSWAASEIITAPLIILMEL